MKQIEPIDHTYESYAGWVHTRDISVHDVCDKLNEAISVINAQQEQIEQLKRITETMGGHVHRLPNYGYTEGPVIVQESDK